MTREEKIKALEEKLFKEIDERKRKYISDLNWALEPHYLSNDIFYRSTMALATVVSLENVLNCSFDIFNETNSSGDYIIKEDTLDILLKKDYILTSICKGEYLHDNFSDEWWEHNSISTYERLAYYRKKREESGNN